MKHTIFPADKFRVALPKSSIKPLRIFDMNWKKKSAATPASLAERARALGTDDLILSTKESALFLGMSHRTLEKWRGQGGKGLPFRKMGRRVGYTLGDVRAYSASRKRRSTSE